MYGELVIEDVEGWSGSLLGGAHDDVERMIASITPFRRMMLELRDTADAADKPVQCDTANHALALADEAVQAAIGAFMAKE